VAKDFAEEDLEGTEDPPEVAIQVSGPGSLDAGFRGVPGPIQLGGIGSGTLFCLRSLLTDRGGHRGPPAPLGGRAVFRFIRDLSSAADSAVAFPRGAQLPGGPYRCFPASRRSANE